MFCGNCGQKLEDGVKFCSQCGKEVQVVENTPALDAVAEEKVETTPVAEQPTASPVQPTAPKQPKKFNKKIIAIAAIAAVLALLLIFNAASIFNFFKKTFSSDEVYLKNVTQDSVNEIAESVGNITKLLDTDELANAAKGSFTIKLGKSATDLLKQYTGADFDWAESATAEIETASDDDKFSVSANIKVNKKEIIQANVILDMETQTLYFQLPDFNKEYVSISLSTITGGQQIDYATYKEQFEAYSDMLPDSKVIEKLIERYMGIVLNCIEKTEKTPETLELGSLSIKCNKYTVNIDGDFIVRATKAVLTEAKNDKDIKKVLIDVATLDNPDVDANEYYTEFQSEIDSLLAEIENGEAPTINYSYDTWIDAKGNLVGLYAAIEDTVISYKNLEKGNKFASNLSLTSAGATLSLSGEGKISGDKKSGEYKLSYMGIDVLEIKAEKFDTEKAKEGYINGEFEIKPSSAVLASFSNSMLSTEINSLLSSLSIGINTENSKKSSETELSINKNGEDMIALIMEAKTESDKKVKLPSKSVSADDSEAMEAWAEKFDTQKIIDNLKKAGVPENILNLLESGADLGYDDSYSNGNFSNAVEALPY